MESLRTLAEWARDCGAEALHLQEGQTPLLFGGGRLSSHGAPALPAGLFQELLAVAGQRIFLEGLGEFRIQLAPGPSVRVQPILPAPSPAQLGIPNEVVQGLVDRPGLTLVCGPPRAWAALIDGLNANTHDHIVILEQPMEWFHFHKMSMICQREHGPDFESWPEAVASSALTGCRGLAVRAPLQRRALGAVLELAKNDQWTLLHCPPWSVEEVLPQLLAVFPAEQRSFFAHRLATLAASIFSFRSSQLQALEIGTALRNLMFDGQYDMLKPTRTWELPCDP